MAQCAHWDKDKIRLCLPSNATLALARLYPMQCVSFTLAPSVGKGRFGSVQGSLLPSKAVLEDRTLLWSFGLVVKFVLSICILVKSELLF